MDCVYYYEEPIMGGRMRICNFGEKPVLEPNCKGCENATSQNDVLECWKKLKRGVFVEVVRCKDCVSCYECVGGELRCDNSYEQNNMDRTVEPNWFCADGERKEDMQEPAEAVDILHMILRQKWHKKVGAVLDSVVMSVFNRSEE